MGTKENMEEAFKGESMANRKYLYFAKVAREEGNEDIANLFEETANNETAHAHAHLKRLYPNLNTKEVLKMAIEGENYESTEMYPKFSDEARGEEKKYFNILSKIEEKHRDKFKEALKKLKWDGNV